MSDKKRNWNMVSGEIDFLEPDRVSGAFSNWKYIVTAEDIAIVTDQIKDSFEKIKNYEFSKGCGEENCNWCTFVRKNELIIPDEAK